MPFLYGNHVLKAHLGRVTEDTPEHTGVVIYNMNDIPLVSYSFFYNHLTFLSPTSFKYRTFIFNMMTTIFNENRFLKYVSSLLFIMGPISLTLIPSTVLVDGVKGRQCTRVRVVRWKEGRYGFLSRYRRDNDYLTFFVIVTLILEILLWLFNDVGELLIRVSKFNILLTCFLHLILSMIGLRCHG